MDDHTLPAPGQYEAFVAGTDADDAPVVMLNLNRYHDAATYADGRAADGLSGRDAYLRYLDAVRPLVTAVGGRLVWQAEAAPALIGCDHEAHHEVVAAWYPSRTAFLGLTGQPGYGEALAHRDAGLASVTILPCAGGAEPELTAVARG